MGCPDGRSMRARWRLRALSDEEPAPTSGRSAGATRIFTASKPNRLRRCFCASRATRSSRGGLWFPEAKSTSSRRRGGSIAFVEVKARADLEVAAIAISATKRRRIAPRRARLAHAKPMGRGPDACGATPSSSRAGGFPVTSRTRIGSRSTDPRIAPGFRPDAHAPDRRRADGPDRAHPHRRRLDLRASSRSPGARPQHPALHARPTEAQRHARRSDGRAAVGQGRRGRSRAPRRGEAGRSFDRRCGAPAPGPAVRPRLYRDDAYSRAHPSANAGRQRSRAACAIRPKSCS